MSSPSLHVKGIKPPDDKWKEMKAVHDACRKAKIDPPKEVEKFFNYEYPDDKGVIVDLDPSKCDAITEYSQEMTDGFEVDLSKLPKDIKIIRFVVSY